MIDRRLLGSAIDGDVQFGLDTHANEEVQIEQDEQADGGEHDFASNAGLVEAKRLEGEHDAEEAVDAQQAEQHRRELQEEVGEEAVNATRHYRRFAYVEALEDRASRRSTSVRQKRQRQVAVAENAAQVVRHKRQSSIAVHGHTQIDNRQGEQIERVGGLAHLLLGVDDGRYEVGARADDKENDGERLVDECRDAVLDDWVGVIESAAYFAAIQDVIDQRCHRCCRRRHRHRWSVKAGDLRH